MEDSIFVIAILACAIGAFCVGALWQLKKVRDLRIIIIKLEHDLARAVGREPRTVTEVIESEEVEEKKKDKKGPWLQRNEHGERPGDICCLRATGKYCYEHNPSNWKKSGKGERYLV